MKEKTIYLDLKDYSVSGEAFQLCYNEALDMLETHPQPSAEKLPDYYKSENYISHTDSKRNIFEKAYHLVKSYALNRKLKLINTFVKAPGNLLDVGCGTGDFLKIAKDKGWCVTGIEPNNEARLIANQKTGQSIFGVEDLLNLKPHSFDVITLWHVLEHLPNLDDHMSVLKSLLKPQGTLIIAVPNFKSYDADFYKQYWAAYDVPRHLWHFSKTSISNLVSKKGMHVKKHMPMIFDSYYVSLLSEKYKTGQMKFIKGFWTGWKSNRKAKHSGEYSSLIYIVKND